MGLGISDEEIEEIREEDPNIWIEEDIFEIADDERLIGCKLDEYDLQIRGLSRFVAVTMLKVKLH